MKMKIKNKNEKKLNLLFVNLTTSVNYQACYNRVTISLKYINKEVIK